MEKLQSALDAFRCYKNRDVEVFLREKAIRYVKQELCSVYLLLNADLLNEKILSIDAYFTLSHKALELNSEMSATRRKNITSSKEAQITSVVLIGQLAKHMALDENGNEVVSELTSKEILDCALQIVMFANEWIVCRAILVETRFEEKLYQIYEKHGFRFLQDNSQRELRQFYLRLKFKQ